MVQRIDALIDVHCYNQYQNHSVRSMAVLSSPPQSPRGFSALPRLLLSAPNQNRHATQAIKITEVKP